MDMHSPLVRSRNMAAIRSSNTTVELRVRRLVFRLGFRYRLNLRDLPGRPDLVFTRMRKVIFVHGCFWHRHRGCRFATTPTTNASYWRAKFATNVNRDKRVLSQLQRDGWTYLVIWECDTKHEASLKDRLLAFLSDARTPASQATEPKASRRKRRRSATEPLRRHGRG
jgi:DNA mismatch endonuclease, patch repair protein